MENNHILEELIAVLAHNPSQAPPLPSSFTSASGGAPLPVPPNLLNVSATIAQHDAGPNAPALPDNFRSDTVGPVHYLSGNEAADVHAPSVLPPQVSEDQVPSLAADHKFSTAPAQQGPMPHNHLTNRITRSHDQNLSSDDKHQQIQVSKVRTIEPPMSALGHAAMASASSAPSSKAPAGPPSMDITAELTAVIDHNRSSNVSRHAPRPAAVDGEPSQRPPNLKPVSATPPTQRPKVTQEQILVGHFCRYAINAVSNAMQDSPLKEQTETRLNEHIKNIWGQWVRGLIQRRKLFVSVTNFVRNTCPNAMGIDVIRDFKKWYEREFELQKARSNVAVRKSSQQPHPLLRHQQRSQALKSKTKQAKRPQKPSVLSAKAVAKKSSSKETIKADTRKPLKALLGLHENTRKRPLDIAEISPLGGQRKKAKTNRKIRKGGTGKKENASSRSTKKTKTAVATDTKAVRSAAAGIQERNSKSHGASLNLVNSVVDLAEEVENLGEAPRIGTCEVSETVDYDADLLLDGSALRRKMKASAKRFGLNENISKNAMEIISLAVRERLKNVFESLKGVAAVRVEAEKDSWKTETYVGTIYEKLKRMSEDEERSLRTAAELRVKTSNKQRESETGKPTSTAEKEGGKVNKDKHSRAVAQLRGKSKKALEKANKEHSNQSHALSGLLAGITKKRKKANKIKGLAALAPFPPIKKLGECQNTTSDLPQMPTPANIVGKDTQGDIGKESSLADKLKSLPPILKVRGPRTANKNETIGRIEEKTEAQSKHSFTLRDCLFLLESEQNTRKSAHIYKWHSRLGATRQVVKGKARKL